MTDGRTDGRMDIQNCYVNIAQTLTRDKNFKKVRNNLNILPH